MTDDFLTKVQVQKLTGKCRRSAQMRELKILGLPYDVNGRGEILVLWSVVQHKMGIKRPTEAAPEPNWGAMYGKTAA
jgi:hypothetical protein